MTARAGESGFAILVALMGVLMISAIGMALVLGTSTETMIARNFRDLTAALYAADAVVARGIADLSAEADWSAVVGGPARSSFFDGGAGGPRVLADRSTIDLTSILNLLNCGKTSPCSDADMDRVTAERPWGQNNPRWRIYACGPLSTLASKSRFYVVLLAADDPWETDNDPLADGVGPGNPGRDIILLRGEAFGPGGSHRVAELSVTRAGAAVRVLSWRAGR